MRRYRRISKKTMKRLDSRKSKGLTHCDRALSSAHHLYGFLRAEVAEVFNFAWLEDEIFEGHSREA